MAKTATQKAAAKARRLKRQGRLGEAQQALDDAYVVPRPDVPLTDKTDYSASTSYRNTQKEIMQLLEDLELLCELRPKKGQEIRMTDLGNITQAHYLVRKAISHMKNNKDVIRKTGDKP